IFAHRDTGVGREILQWCRLRRGRGDDDRIFHRAILFERADDLRDGRALLTDGDVDAVELLALLAALVDFLLVDEGVERDCGLTGLAVTDDQLALAAANRYEGVERLEAGLHGLVHRLARDDAWRLHLDAAALGELDRALAVDWVAESVDDAAEQALADRDVNDGAGPLDGRAFLDLGVRAEDHDTDVVGLKVEGHALGAVAELDHLAGLDIVEAVDAGDAVTDRQNGADLRDFGVGVEVCNLVADDARDFSGADVHSISLSSPERVG